MESLPIELKYAITGCLDPIDLKALRLVNKKFAAIASWYLFKVLKFNGSQWGDHHIPIPNAGATVGMAHGGITGQRRIVEYAELPSVIEEVLPNAKSMKQLMFSPAYYREGMTALCPNLLA